ncbi:MAG TPA: hypothetical protein VK211_20035 [Kamptonema sp.]|nr:hypothetical protein [Kamptonema sp.]
MANCSYLNTLRNWQMTMSAIASPVKIQIADLHHPKGWRSHSSY